LKSPSFLTTAIGKKTGTAIRRIILKNIKGIKINIPISLSEQKRIVSVLDDVFNDAERYKAISNRNFQKTKDTFDAFLYNVFNNPGSDWVDTTIGKIAKIKGGKRVPRGYKMEDKPTPHPYIRVCDFSDNGTIDVESLKYVDDKVYEQIKNYTITDKDLYISIAGTIGKTGIVPSELNGANLTENASKLVFEKDIYNKYVYFFTRSNTFIEQAGLNTRTTAMPKLALTRLSNIRIRIPKSYTEQIVIATKIDSFNEELNRLNKVYSEKINHINLLKQSVLNKAFKGEL
jgi:type I restriction enzyme S subunit